jgi:hypothetical protein
MKAVARQAESRWRRWLLLLAVALGILAGAVAAGRIRLPIHW